MDRRKAKIRSTYDRLKEECEATVDLLNEIIEKNSYLTATVESLNDYEILTNPTHFLNVTEFQHSALQKVLEVSLQLEAFLASHMTVNTGTVPKAVSVSSLSLAPQIATSANSNNVPDIEQTYSTNQSEIKTETAHQVIKLSEINHTDNINSELDEKSEAKTTQLVDEKVVQIPDNDDGKNEDVDLSTVNLENQTNEMDNTTERGSNLEATLNNIMKQDKTDEMINTDCVENMKETDTGTENQINDAFFKSESSDYPDETDTNKKSSSSDVSSTEDPAATAEPAKLTTNEVSEVPSKTVQEKLKSRKLLNRRDRYLQSLPKPQMPDLTFRPSSRTVELSDSFATCVESSQSSDNYKVRKDKKKKKKRNESVMKTEEIVDLPKVPHLSLEDAPEPYVGMPCVVSCVESPSELYISIADENTALIDCMAMQIAELYEKTRSPYETKDDARESLGKYCVVFVREYNCWYRVEILNWHVKGRSYLADVVTVQLVDYGHIKDVSYKDLRQLIFDFCHIRKCAIKCHLAALYPPGSTHDRLLETWPSEALKTLNDILVNVDDTVYKVAYVEDVQNSWAIDLIDVQKDEDKVSVGQELIDAGCAVEIIQDPTALVKSNFFINQLKTAQVKHIFVHMELFDNCRINVMADEKDISSPHRSIVLGSWQSFILLIPKPDNIPFVSTEVTCIMDVLESNTSCCKDVQLCVPVVYVHFKFHLYK